MHSLLSVLYKSKEEKSSYKENEISQVSSAIKQNIYKNSLMVRYFFEDGDNWPDLRLVYTSDFGARFCSKLVRSSKYNYFYI